LANTCTQTLRMAYLFCYVFLEALKAAKTKTIQGMRIKIDSDGKGYGKMRPIAVRLIGWY